MNKNNKRINTDKVFDFTNTILLIIISFTFLYPLIYVVSASISEPASVLNGDVLLLPRGVHFKAYERIFLNNDILNGYKNTVMYTVVGTVVSLCVTIMAAYPLSRKGFYGRKLISLILVITMFFNGGMIPTYLLIKQLNLIDNFWVMILPAMVSVFNVFVMRTSFESSIPQEMYEAAYIDGCSEIGILIRIVLPLSGAVIAVIGLFYAVGYWNSYFNALLYLSKREMFPLTLILRDILTRNDTSTMLQSSGSPIKDREQYGVIMRYSSIVVASLPVLMLYPFVQKYFVKGVMIGAVKG